jgi:hypothetical protein
MAQLQGIGNVVRNSVVGTVRGTGEVFDAVAETVSHSLATVLRSTGTVGGALGETGTAGRLAWQARLDARLAWGMTESEQLRAEAAAVGGAAGALITRLVAPR